MSSIRNLLRPNRVAFVVGLIGAILTALVTFQTSLVPGSPGEEAIAKGVIILAAVYKGITLVEKFLDGSQNWDSLLVSGLPKNAQVGTVVVNKSHDFPLGNTDDGSLEHDDPFPDREITEQDNVRAFGTTEPLPDAERAEGFEPLEGQDDEDEKIPENFPGEAARGEDPGHPPLRPAG